MNDQPGFFLNLALALPAKLFGGLAKIRGRLYNSGLLEIVDTSVPVISIGNITAGGTGKTPITSFFASDLTARGLKCAIVSRGYGGSERGPVLVSVHDADVEAEMAARARRFGDEPSWLAAQHPAVPVVVGARRPEAIAFLKSARADVAKGAASARLVVLADDAFQHRRLKRDLDLVILDATEPRWHYRPLPQGRLREGFEALARANFILISKTNLAEPAQLEWLREQIRPFHKPIIEFAASLKGFVALRDDRPFAVAGRLPARNVVLMSAIARPQTFEQLVNESVPGLKILKHFVFPDHHAFTVSDLESIEAQALKMGAEAVVVTEKDATKLREWRPRLACYVSRLVASPRTDLGEFHEAVDRIHQ